MLKITPPKNYCFKEFLPQVISAIQLQQGTTDSCLGKNQSSQESAGVRRCFSKQFWQPSQCTTDKCSPGEVQGQQESKWTSVPHSRHNSLLIHRASSKEHAGHEFCYKDTCQSALYLQISTGVTQNWSWLDLLSHLCRAKAQPSWKQTSSMFHGCCLTTQHSTKSHSAW